MADFIDAMAQQSAANSAFNAQQAQINRDFQEYMSSTAHQREVQDLQNAGLNPILSANNGAAIGNGSAASADTSASSGYAALAQTAMNNAASITMANIAASAQTAAAGIAAAAARYSADTSYTTSTEVAKINQSGNPVAVATQALSGLTGKTNINDFFKNLNYEFQY